MEQDRIDHAENRGIGRDPESKRDDGDESECRRLEQLAKSNA
jgi:hypothetical protein